MRETVKWRCFLGHVHHARSCSSQNNMGGFSSGESCSFVCLGDIFDEYLVIFESFDRKIFKDFVNNL